MLAELSLAKHDPSPPVLVVRGRRSRLEPIRGQRLIGVVHPRGPSHRRRPRRAPVGASHDPQPPVAATARVAGEDPLHGGRAHVPRDVFGEIVARHMGATAVERIFPGYAGGRGDRWLGIV